MSRSESGSRPTDVPGCGMQFQEPPRGSGTASADLSTTTDVKKGATSRISRARDVFRPAVDRKKEDDFGAHYRACQRLRKRDLEDIDLLRRNTRDGLHGAVAYGRHHRTSQDAPDFRHSPARAAAGSYAGVAGADQTDYGYRRCRDGLAHRHSVLVYPCRGHYTQLARAGGLQTGTRRTQRRNFTIFKFRSMYRDAEQRSGPTWASKTIRASRRSVGLSAKHGSTRYRIPQCLQGRDEPRRAASRTAILRRTVQAGDPLVLYAASR